MIQLCEPLAAIDYHPFLAADVLSAFRSAPPTCLPRNFENEPLKLLPIFDDTSREERVKARDALRRANRDLPRAVVDGFCKRYPEADSLRRRLLRRASAKLKTAAWQLATRRTVADPSVWLTARLLDKVEEHAAEKLASVADALGCWKCKPRAEHSRRLYLAAHDEHLRELPRRRKHCDFYHRDQNTTARDALETANLALPRAVVNDFCKRYPQADSLRRDLVRLASCALRTAAWRLASRPNVADPSAWLAARLLETVEEHAASELLAKAVEASRAKRANDPTFCPVCECIKDECACCDCKPPRERIQAYYEAAVGGNPKATEHLQAAINELVPAVVRKFCWKHPEADYYRDDLEAEASASSVTLARVMAAKPGIKSPIAYIKICLSRNLENVMAATRGESLKDIWKDRPQTHKNLRAAISEAGRSLADIGLYTNISDYRLSAFMVAQDVKVAKRALSDFNVDRIADFLKVNVRDRPARFECSDDYLPLTMWRGQEAPVSPVAEDMSLEELHEEVMACCVSERERMIIGMHLAGKTDQEIACTLDLARSTIQGIRSAVKDRVIERNRE
jgi:hypothetical protein